MRPRGLGGPGGKTSRERRPGAVRAAHRHQEPAQHRVRSRRLRVLRQPGEDGHSGRAAQEGGLEHEEQDRCARRGLSALQRAENTLFMTLVTL